MKSLTVEGLTKIFGDVRAVDDLSFSVEEGEFFSILGPSGCGKTTTLRCITGFEEPTHGNIYLNGDLSNHIPPDKRDVSMVFQGFALFPHKTVGENIGFGLKIRNVPKEERMKRVEKTLETVNLPGMADRYPDELSGGQQQRVALARALIVEPTVLTLDEPLASLDRQLRERMRYELKRLQEEYNVTMIYVTHDQSEALAMSDRMLVMNDGSVEQIGTPAEIYHNPKSQFIANFIGESNVFEDIELTADLHASMSLSESNTLRFDASKVSFNGDTPAVSIRPEDIMIVPKEDGLVSGTVLATTFHGNVIKYVIDIGGKEVKAEINGTTVGTQYDVGDEVWLHWNSGDLTPLES